MTSFWLWWLKDFRTQKAWNFAQTFFEMSRFNLKVVPKISTTWRRQYVVILSKGIWKFLGLKMGEISPRSSLICVYSIKKRCQKSRPPEDVNMTSLYPIQSNSFYHLAKIYSINMNIVCFHFIYVSNWKSLLSIFERKNEKNIIMGKFYTLRTLNWFTFDSTLFFIL